MDTNNNPGETPPKLPPTPSAIAGAFLRAQTMDGATPDWREQDPIRVYEMTMDPTTQEVVHLVELAAGHSPRETLALAAQAPFYADRAPDAIVITAPGELSTNDESLRAISENRDEAQRLHENRDTHTPHRGCRALTVTPTGFGGAIVAELSDGTASHPVHGTETADPDNPMHFAAAALLASRRVSALGRTLGTLDAIRDALETAGIDFDALEQSDLDRLDDDTRDTIREAVRASVTAAGVTDLLDELGNPHRPSDLPDDYREQAQRLLDNLDG